MSTEENLNKALVDANRRYDAFLGKDVLTKLNDRLSGSAVRNQTPSAEAYGYNGTTQRKPWVMTCDTWLSENKMIVWNPNPNSIRWRVPQREAISITKTGIARHVWRDLIKGSHFGEAEIGISFQAGNLVPVVVRNKITPSTKQNQTAAQVDTGEFGIITGVDRTTKNLSTDMGFARYEDNSLTVSQSITNFYMFFDLIDQQRINASGNINYITIIMSTLLFPRLIVKGLFTPDDLGWGEIAEDPNNIQDWNANFTVYEMYPAIGRNRFQEALNLYLTSQAPYNRLDTLPTKTV